MATKLEAWCQHEVETLLQQKEHFLKRKEQNNGLEQCHLPHYKTIHSLYKSLEESELFLLEIDDKLQTLEREMELKTMKAELSFVKLSDAFENETPRSAIRTWLKEIMLHNKNKDIVIATEDDVAERLFFDVHFQETEELEILTWSTMYKTRCVRVSVSASLMCASTEPTDYTFSSSFYVDGLVSKGQEYISAGAKVEDYVKILWTGLQIFIDIT